MQYVAGVAARRHPGGVRREQRVHPVAGRAGGLVRDQRLADRQGRRASTPRDYSGGAKPVILGETVRKRAVRRRRGRDRPDRAPGPGAVHGGRRAGLEGPGWLRTGPGRRRGGAAGNRAPPLVELAGHAAGRGAEASPSASTTRATWPARRPRSRRLLRQRHKIEPGADDDFAVRNISQIVATRTADHQPDVASCWARWPASA